MPDNEDVLSFPEIPEWIFDEVRTARRPVVHVKSKKTGQLLRFVADFTPGVAVVETNRRGWPVERWRGQRTS